MGLKFRFGHRIFTVSPYGLLGLDIRPVQDKSGLHEVVEESGFFLGDILLGSPVTT